MEEKILLKEFTDDIYGVLKKNAEYNSQTAWNLIKSNIIEKIIP